MTEKTEDIAKIKSILLGDLNSEKIFYEKYWKIISDYITFIYGNVNDIEDDVSEILSKVFSKLNTYDSELASPKTWVLKISKNHMIDKFRSQTIEKCISFGYEDLSDHHLNDVSISFDNSFENKDTLEFISNGLNSFDFTLLDMKYNFGYNYKEIGQEFNLTSSTVSNRVNYVKNKIQRNLCVEI